MKGIIESILRTLGVDPALVGDLVEQHSGGRSTAWFIRQSLIAAASTCVRGWTSQKMLVVRSLALGTAAVYLLNKAAWYPARAASRLFGLHVGNYLLETNRDVMRQMFMQFHLYDLPFVAFRCLVFAVAGWIVARSLRAYQMPVVVLFVVVIGFWWGYGVVVQYHDAALVPRANLYPFMELLAVLLLAPCVVIGGAAGTRDTPSLPTH